MVRLALYTAENGGWREGGERDELYNLVRDGVSFATEADLYAIVDWHVLSDANPLAHADEAAGFFGRISADLSGNNNVIYEICNEPNNGTTWEDAKAYAERIIPIIRANDPDAVIVAGTRVVATSTVSLVTVGAFIGVRSLGTLFTDGFQRGLIAEVVAGLVATVLLALVIDALIQGIGWALTPWTRRGQA